MSSIVILAMVHVYYSGGLFQGVMLPLCSAGNKNRFRMACAAERFAAVEYNLSWFATFCYEGVVGA